MRSWWLSMAVYKDIVSKISVPADKKTKQKEYKKSGKVPIVDQGQNLIGGYTDDDNKVLNCEKPVIIFGDHTCAVKFISFPFGVGADGVKVLKPKADVLPKYLYYGTQYLVLQLQDRGYARHYQHIEKMNLPIFSIPEQENIVAKIEEMFSQLDEGIETLDKIKYQISIYRHAVIKDAFRNLYEKKRIREITSIVTSGSRGWAKYYSDSGTSRFVRITDLTRDKISLKNDSIQYLDLPDNVEGKRSRLCENDVLVSITADLGSIALVPANMGEAYINQHIAMVRFNNSKQGKFMAFYLKSDYGQRDLLKNKRGGGKLGLGLDDIRNIMVPNVTDKQAENIVCEIESRLSVCDSIEQTIDNVLAQAEALRQSILKKAFEGRLI